MQYYSIAAMANAKSSVFRKKGASIVALLAAMLVSDTAHPYSPGKKKDWVQCGEVIIEGTHPLLSRASVQFYNDNFGEKYVDAAAEELIAKGAIQEDSPEACYIRSFNHFTDVETGKGMYGFSSSKQWAQDAQAQSGKVPLENLKKPGVPFGPGLHDFYGSVLDKYDGYYPEGDNSFETAVKNKSFRSLGHTLHLIQDLTAPAHTRADPHPFFPICVYDDPNPPPSCKNYLKCDLENPSPACELYLTEFELHEDSFEFWVEEYAEVNLKNCVEGKKCMLNPAKVKKYKNISEIFDEVIQFSGTRFFSDSSIEKYAEPRNSLKPVLIEGKQYYYAENDENFEPIIIARKGYLKPYILDAKVLDMQWKILGTKAIELGASVIALYMDSIEGSKPNGEVKCLYDFCEAYDKCCPSWENSFGSSWCNPTQEECNKNGGCHYFPQEQVSLVNACLQVGSCWDVYDCLYK